MNDEDSAPRSWMDEVAARVRATPDLLADLVEQLLDRTVTSAIADPLDVGTPDEAYERVRDSALPNTAGLVAGWLAGRAGRWTTRTVHLGKRFSLPVSALLTAFPPLAMSFRRGTVELRVLASLVVNHLHADGIAVDERFVQRVTINAYCWSNLGNDVVRERPTAIVRLATLLITRAVGSDEPGVRVRDAARALDKLNLAELSSCFAR